MLLEEFALDRDPTRFALIVTLPVIFCVSIVRIHLRVSVYPADA